MTAVARQRLPDRRITITERVTWQGRSWHVSIGFDAAGRAREIFLAGAKAGSEMDAIANDAAVLASMMLQAGGDPAAIARSMGRIGPAPASIVGLALDCAAAVEASEGAAIRSAHGEGRP